MRSDKRAETKAIKKGYANLRKRQISAFLLIFFLWTGLAIVDNACSEMTGYRESLSLTVRKVQSDKVFISFLGKEAYLNISTSFTD